MFCSSRLAPRTTAPVESVTVPTIEDVNVCAAAWCVMKTASSTKSTADRPRTREHITGLFLVALDLIRPPESGSKACRHCVFSSRSSLKAFKEPADRAPDHCFKAFKEVPRKTSFVKPSLSRSICNRRIIFVFRSKQHLH